MRTRLVLAVLPIALVGVTAATSMAAPKEMKGSFDASALPDPSYTGGEVCHGLSPAGRFEVPLKITGPGKLKVDLAFTGDWDLTLEDAKGRILAESAEFEAQTEAILVKLKKAAEVTIVACNYAGAPTAKGTYVFTPTK